MFNDLEGPVMRFLERNAARLDMHLSWQSGVAFATISRPGRAPLPAEKAPGMPLPPRRETTLSTYRRRVSSGWKSHPGQGRGRALNLAPSRRKRVERDAQERVVRWAP